MEKPTPEFEHFLNIRLDFGGGFQHRPIVRFDAAGSFVSEKLQKLREEFAGKPLPSDDEATRSLVAQGPKYGPANKKAFLSVLPQKQIEKVTGCRLRPETATFVAVANVAPYKHQLPDLQWWVRGTVPATKNLPAGNCGASFEPFEGRLTHFDEDLFSRPKPRPRPE